MLDSESKLQSEFNVEIKSSEYKNENDLASTDLEVSDQPCDSNGCLDRLVTRHSRYRYMPYHFPTATSVMQHNQYHHHKFMKEARKQLQTDLACELKGKALDMFSDGLMKISCGDLLEGFVKVGDNSQLVERRVVNDYFKNMNEDPPRLSVLEEVVYDLKHITDDDESEHYYWKVRLLDDDESLDNEEPKDDYVLEIRSYVE